MGERSSGSGIIGRYLWLIDTLGHAFAFLSMVLLGVLVCITFYEMVVRYFLDGSTVWGNETAYMVNGAIFLFAAAYTLKLNRHVRIDVLSTRMPEHVRQALEAVFYLIMFLPAIGIMAYGAYAETWRNFVTEERTLSAWAPLLWPFSAVIAVSLSLLWLQAFAEFVRCVAYVASRRSSP